MKKTFISSMMVCAMAVTLGCLFSAPVQANNQEEKPCQKKIEAPAQTECFKPMTPEERAKLREEKKAEFEARLNLTEKQKAKLEKIKADEKKALEPYREKIKKEQAKIEELFEQEKAIRMDSMKKFEATLTAEQKAELEKMKQEFKEKMEKIGPRGPKGPHGMIGPKGSHHPGPQPCPPDCQCGCHNPEAAEPADCKCPCHNQPVAPEKVKPQVEEPVKK